MFEPRAFTMHTRCPRATSAHSNRAGSAALLLLVLAAVPSLGVGLVYILVFGTGSILGMVFLATAMSIPFAMSAERMSRVQQTLRGAAALFSIVLGITILVELLIV